ncbi:tyrosine-type recombinase/integrase [Rhodomicrobium sp. Az07]|uniref:site-specific integrase n=1 Tax=Rhodomicrobium sp. Az07 TaxID=2839034 RepID=UPI001BE85156|nr:site-specific integrase [Rhodomicrobium sp. Az07]MBT3071447.1 tyrosine-type recombinase/integrase [Rhodomicrobium sp. Az07]
MADRSRINLATLKTLPPQQVAWDDSLKGFGAKANANGTVTFFVKTRVNGKQRWFTIGKRGSPWTVETARREALAILANAAEGKDRTEEKRRERASTFTLGELAVEYFNHHKPLLKPVTFENYQTSWRRHLQPELGKIALGKLSVADISKLNIALCETPSAANYAMAVLSAMLGWSEDQGLRPANSNPCRKIPKYRENKRERYLSPEELERLGKVLADSEKRENPYVLAAIRLLLLTGARLSEILTLRWSYIDRHRRVLALPDSKTGAKVIPLSQPALDLLSGLPRFKHNPFVLPGLIEGQHLVNLQKPWRRIRKEAGLDDVRIHDLRHSFASVSVGLGGSLPVIGRVLGHSQPATTARYAHVADKVAAELVEATGALIGTALQSGSKPSTPQ